MKQHSSSSNRKQFSGKEAKPVRRESREVMADLVAQLTKQRDAERTVLGEEAKSVAADERANLNGLTVGVDIGDQWSNYCILGLG